MTPIVLVQNVIHPLLLYLKGTVLENKDLQAQTPLPTPLLNNKMQTVCDGVMLDTKYRTRVGQKHFVCSINLIETFIFDRKADQY